MAFFYLKKPRKFNYQPIYYDQDKEFHDQIIANAKRDLGIREEGEEYKPNIKGRFRTQEGKKEITFNFKRRVEKQPATRTITLIILLAAVIYFLMTANLDGLFSSMADTVIPGVD